MTGSFSFDAGASGVSGLRTKMMPPRWRSTTMAPESLGALPGTASACASLVGSGRPACVSGTRTSAARTARTPLRMLSIVPWDSEGRELGRAAHCLAGPEPQESGGMSELRLEIAALLGDEAGDLDQVERKLTDGYAAALSLEARRGGSRSGWRMRRYTWRDGDAASNARELSSLARRLTGRRGDLASLRALLADLRRHADALRLETANQRL